VNPRASFDRRQNAVYSVTHGKRIGAVRSSTRTRRGISRTVARSYLEIEKRRGGRKGGNAIWSTWTHIHCDRFILCFIFFVCRVVMTWLSNLDE
jgi:hypothetical protein